MKVAINLTILLQRWIVDIQIKLTFWGKGSERQKSLRQKSKKEHRKSTNVQKEHQKSEHWKSPLKWSEHWKIRTTTTTYGVVPMDTKACGGLG